MNFLKQLFSSKSKQLEIYNYFEDYLRSTSPIEVLHIQGDEIAKVGETERITSVNTDAENASVTLTYQMTPEIRELMLSNVVEFNGMDICAAEHPQRKESLHIPMRIRIYVQDEEIPYDGTYNVPVAYGEREVTHTIPCATLAKYALADIISGYVALEKTKDQLTVQKWDFDNGVLHVYTTLVGRVKTKINLKNYSIPVFFTPQVAYAYDDVHMLMNGDEAEELVDRYIDKNRYSVQWYLDSDYGVDEIVANKVVRTETFPKEDMQVLTPFIEHLTDLGFCIDDELLYDYFQKGGRLNG